MRLIAQKCSGANVFGGSVRSSHSSLVVKHRKLNIPPYFAAHFILFANVILMCAAQVPVPTHLPKYAGLSLSDPALSSNSGNKSFGLLSIPSAPVWPIGACVKAVNCALEYSGDLEGAFALYERLTTNCSDHGWVTVAHLGRGETAEVILRQTPCGTLVAMKVPMLDPEIPIAKRLDAQRNIAADCAVLKRLSPFLDDPSCDGCFPQYYYYSNTSGICYNEYKKSIPLGAFFRTLYPRYGDNGMSNATLRLSFAKALFQQGLSALAILKQNRIVHRDLLSKNMLVRLQPRSDPPFRLVIMDFCWATSEYDVGVTRGFTMNRLGHFTRTPDWREHGWEDTYALACGFAARFLCETCHDQYRTYCLENQDQPRKDTASMEYLWWRMTAPEYASRLHNIDEMQRLLAGVTHIREGGDE